MTAKKKVQRITMRMDGSPLKLDGTVTEIGTYKDVVPTFRVAFDGPYPDTTFYVVGETMAADKPPEVSEKGDWAAGRSWAGVAGAKFWKVL